MNFVRKIYQKVIKLNIFNKIQLKLSKYIPKFMKTNYGELHLPGKNYCGPLTRLAIWLDENDIPKPGEKPTNKVDKACLKHDIVYRNKDIRSRQKADIDLIQDLNEIENPTFKEKLNRVMLKQQWKQKLFLEVKIKLKIKMKFLQQSCIKNLETIKNI